MTRRVIGRGPPAKCDTTAFPTGAARPRSSLNSPPYSCRRGHRARRPPPLAQQLPALTGQHQVRRDADFSTQAPPTPPLQRGKQRALELAAPTSTLNPHLAHRRRSVLSSRWRQRTSVPPRRTVAAQTGLPDGYRTRLVHRRAQDRAQDLYETIPTQHQRERAARELRLVLAS
jgi:hypothetical protein